MHRRNFMAGSSALLLGSLNTTGALAQTAPPPAPINGTSGIKVVATIKSLRIPTGPYAGGYEMAPNGRLNWYFTQLGLIPIVQYLNAADLDLYIRTYLDLYLRSLTSIYSIDDINFPFGRANTSIFEKVPSDSDDSYAATLLSLTARYLRASGNWAWWDANKARLKEVAYRNLAMTIKRDGLTSVFQAPRSSTNSIGYLMDNCEVYRGLRDYASLLRDRGELADANYYDSFGTTIATSISKLLFSTASNAFKISDANVNAETTFYAGTTCQVFPEAFGMTELASRFSAGWAYLNTYTPNWQDGRYDPYPWAVLGCVAAQRGQVTQARAQLTSIENKFISNRPLITINELGFYQRNVSILAGRPAV